MANGLYHQCKLLTNKKGSVIGIGNPTMMSPYLKTDRQSPVPFVF